MPFEKGVSGNPEGRPTADRLIHPKSLDAVQVREREFSQIIRRLKPLTKKALVQLEKMIEADSTTEATRMRAIAFVIKEYEILINDVYKPVQTSGQDKTEDEEEQATPAPIVSLRVVSSN